MPGSLRTSIWSTYYYKAPVPASLRLELNIFLWLTFPLLFSLLSLASFLTAFPLVDYDLCVLCFRFTCLRGMSRLFCCTARMIAHLSWVGG